MPRCIASSKNESGDGLFPFETPKLAVTAQITEQDFATLLDRRLKRLEEMKLIEATNGAKVKLAERWKWF